MTLCISLGKEDEEWETDAEIRSFVERCSVIRKTIHFLPSRVNRDIPYLHATEAAFILFFAAYIVLVGIPGVLVVAITLLLATDAVVDAITEILPDSMTVAIFLLFSLRSVDMGFDFLRWLPATLLFCAVCAAVYIKGKGRGDMKLICAMALGAGPVFTLVSLAGAILLMLARRVKKGVDTPLVPYLFAGTCVAFIMEKHVLALIAG